MGGGPLLAAAGLLAPLRVDAHRCRGPQTVVQEAEYRVLLRADVWRPARGEAAAVAGATEAASVEALHRGMAISGGSSHSAGSSGLRSCATRAGRCRAPNAPGGWRGLRGMRRGSDPRSPSPAAA
jgi:hypothetical protein